MYYKNMSNASELLFQLMSNADIFCCFQNVTKAEPSAIISLNHTWTTNLYIAVRRKR